MVKVYKLEVYVTDWQDRGYAYIQNELNNTDCVRLDIVDCDERDVGEWSDEHALNRGEGPPMDERLRALFAPQAKAFDVHQQYDRVERFEKLWLARRKKELASGVGMTFAKDERDDRFFVAWLASRGKKIHVEMTDKEHEELRLEYAKWKQVLWMQETARNDDSRTKGIDVSEWRRMPDVSPDGAVLENKKLQGVPSLKEFQQSGDAREWAKAFLRYYEVSRVEGAAEPFIGLGNLTGWFANAMCVAADIERRKRVEVTFTEDADGSIGCEPVTLDSADPEVRSDCARVIAEALHKAYDLWDPSESDFFSVANLTRWFEGAMQELASSHQPRLARPSLSSGIRCTDEQEPAQLGTADQVAPKRRDGPLHA